MDVGSLASHPASVTPALAAQTARQEIAVEGLNKAKDTHAETALSIIEGVSEPQTFNAQGQVRAPAVGGNLNVSA